jgi:hypothetical protein
VKSVHKVLLLAVPSIFIAFALGACSTQSLNPDSSSTPKPNSTSSTATGGNNSTAYKIGFETAQSYISTGALTRAIYEQLGGLGGSCEYILNSYMAYHGGSSSNQEYADFKQGCSAAVRAWY